MNDKIKEFAFKEADKIINNKIPYSLNPLDDMWDDEDDDED